MDDQSRGGSSLISWERARGIFGDPKPPVTVWERQFDYFDEDLERLASTPYEQIDFSDLWYYYHDLAYVELQPDLFDYLFPVCLMDWHRTLMANLPCSHGDSDFHYGLHRGNVFDKMMVPERRDAIYEFFRDSFIERLDAERGFGYSGSNTPAYGWIHRLNSLGIVIPRMDLLWDSWWALETPGRAVAALQYCSGLMYFEGENPLFPAWTKEKGGGGLYNWENDTQIYDVGWMECNLEFLRTTLTAEFVSDGVSRAAALLRGEPESEMACRLEADLPACKELVAIRISELPVILSRPSGSHGWSH